MSADEKAEARILLENLGKETRSDGITNLPPGGTQTSDPTTQRGSDEKPRPGQTGVDQDTVVELVKKGDGYIVVSRPLNPPVVPVKRGRGRPRKTDAPVTPKPPTPGVKRPRKTVVPNPERGIIPSRRANRGRPPVKFEPDFENKKKYDYEEENTSEKKSKFYADSEDEDDFENSEVDDDEFTPAKLYTKGEGIQIMPKKKRGRGRPPLLKKIKNEPPIDSEYGQNKENVPKANILPENPNVTVNISVQDKKCAPYLNQIGVYVTYFCRKCVYNSKQITDVAKHIDAGNHLPRDWPSRRGRRAEADIAASVNKVLEDEVDEQICEGKGEEGQEHMEISLIETPQGAIGEEGEKPTKPWKHFMKVQEHNYAEVDIEGEDEVEEEEEKSVEKEVEEEEGSEENDEIRWEEFDSDEDVDPNAPKKWLCDKCHYTTFYSERDFVEHRRCHSNNTKRLHCWRCKEDGKRNILKGFEWHRLKVHLTTVHAVDYRISCPKCDEMFPTHVTYRKHRGTHLLKCPHDFCKFESEDQKDIDTHLQCHDADNPRNFHCFVCSYVCEKRPFKWSTMHSHLVTQHSGVISATYTCEECKRGFQEMRRLAEHRKTCGTADSTMECELCGKMIYRSKFMSHAVWHVKKEEEAEKKRNKDISEKFEEISEKDPNEAAEGLAALSQVAQVELAQVNESEKSALTEVQMQTQAEYTTPTLAAEAAMQQITIEGNTCDDLTNKAIAEVLVAAAGQPMEINPDGVTEEEQQTQTIVLGPEQLQQLAEGAGDGETIVAIVEETEGADGTSQQTVTYHIQSSMGQQDVITEPDEASQQQQAEQEQDLILVSQESGNIISENGESIREEEETIGKEKGDIEAEFQCIEHEETFESQLELTRHYVEVHWGISREVLKQAETSIERKREERRLALVREDKSEGEHKCKHCYKRFGSAPRLAKHIKRAHTAEKLKRVLCQQCGKDFRNRSQFRNHYRVVHEGKKRKPPLKPYYARRKFFVCELCGYTTPENIRLKNHKLSVHDGVMPYQCDMCSYSTNEKSDMRRHKHKHAGIKRYPCEFCPYRTDQRWLLVNHCHRQHGIQLPKVSRDTRGCFWSNRRRKKEEEELQQQAVAILPQSIPVEGLMDLQTGTEEVTVLYEDYVGDETAIVEEEVAVETIRQETQDGGEVIYMREDGTILEPEEAALMLLAVNPEAVQVETNYQE